MFESPLDGKEIQSVNPKGNQSWIFIGRIDAEAETPILWPPDAKNWLLGKDPDAGKDWSQEEKGTREYEMVGWHRWLYGLSLSKLWELAMDREAWHAAVHEIAKSQTQLSKWTEQNWFSYMILGTVYNLSEVRFSHWLVNYKSISFMGFSEDLMALSVS